MSQKISNTNNTSNVPNNTSNVPNNTSNVPNNTSNVQATIQATNNKDEELTIWQEVRSTRGQSGFIMYPIHFVFDVVKYIAKLIVYSFTSIAKMLGFISDPVLEKEGVDTDTQIKKEEVGLLKEDLIKRVDKNNAEITMELIDKVESLQAQVDKLAAENAKMSVESKKDKELITSISKGHDVYKEDLLESLAILQKSRTQHNNDAEKIAELEEKIRELEYGLEVNSVKLNFSKGLLDSHQKLVETDRKSIQGMKDCSQNLIDRMNEILDNQDFKNFVTHSGMIVTDPQGNDVRVSFKNLIEEGIDTYSNKIRQLDFNRYAFLQNSNKTINDMTKKYEVHFSQMEDEEGKRVAKVANASPIGSALLINNQISSFINKSTNRLKDLGSLSKKTDDAAQSVVTKPQPAETSQGWVETFKSWLFKNPSTTLQAPSSTQVAGQGGTVAASV